MVVVEDPEAGYMANDKISPDMMKTQRTVDAKRYSFETFFDLSGFTNSGNQQTVEVLSAASAISRQDALDLALDEKWSGSEAGINALEHAINKDPSAIGSESAELRRFEDRIVHFDGFARKDSANALDYLYWRTAVGQGPDPDALAEKVEQHEELAAAQESALIAGAAPLRISSRYMGSLKPPWETSTGSDVEARAGRSGGVKFRAGGEDLTTLRAMEAGSLDSQGRRWVWAGQRLPCLTIFSDPIQSFTSAPFRQSDHPHSTHYIDQARLASDHQLKPNYFNRSDLMKHVVSTQMIKAPDGLPTN